MIAIGNSYLYEDKEILYVTDITKEYIHTKVISLGNYHSKPDTTRLFTYQTFIDLALKRLTFSTNFATEDQLKDHIQNLKKTLWDGD